LPLIKYFFVIRTKQINSGLIQGWFLQRVLVVFIYWVFWTGIWPSVSRLIILHGGL